MELMGTQAVGKKTGFLTFLGDTQATIPIGGCSLAIAIVIQNCVFGSKPVFILVKIRRVSGGCQPGFQEGGLTILIKVCLQIADSRRQVATKMAEVLLKTASSGR